MMSLRDKLAHAGYRVPGEAEPPRAALLADLRRRIARLELRPAPPPTAPRLPPGPTYAGGRRAPLRITDLGGAAERDGAVVVTSRFGPEERLGAVALADALVADPDVAAPLAAGLPGGSPAPRDLLHGLRVLDLETTGLSGGTGTLAFLVGVGRFEPDGAFVTEQLLCPSPADEPHLLDRLAERLDGATSIVSFNGRAFDAPLLRTRCILAGAARHVALARTLAALPHLDLLLVARRLWRGRVADCRLVTLEDRVLGRRRVDDLPGSMAPVAYQRFLATGDAALLAPIVAHNRDDLCGTAALLGAALRTLEDPLTWAEDASELAAVGEHRMRLSDPQGALPLLERAAAIARTPEPLRRALVQLARLYRRAGRLDDARRAWERYRADFPRENLGYVELAKLLEHRVRDPAAALAVAASAPHTAADAMQRRLARLRARAERSPAP